MLNITYALLRNLQDGTNYKKYEDSSMTMSEITTPSLPCRNNNVYSSVKKHRNDRLYKAIPCLIRPLFSGFFL